MNKLILIVSAALFLTSCGGEETVGYEERKKAEEKSLDEKYQDALEEYKAESKSDLEAKFTKLQNLQEDLIAITEVQPEKVQKDISLSFFKGQKENPFNSILVLGDYFDHLYDHSIYTADYVYLYNIRRLIEDKKLDFGEGYNTPDLMMDNLNGFELYANDFMNLKYVVVLSDLEVYAPKLQSSSEFTPGTYKGHVAVFDIENKQLLNNYIITSTNSSNINFYATEGDEAEALRNAQDRLNEDYFVNIVEAVKAGLKKRYTFDYFMSGIYTR